MAKLPKELSALKKAIVEAESSINSTIAVLEQLKEMPRASGISVSSDDWKLPLTGYIEIVTPKLETIRKSIIRGKDYIKRLK